MGIEENKGVYTKCTSTLVPYMDISQSASTTPVHISRHCWYTGLLGAPVKITWSVMFSMYKHTCVTVTANASLCNSSACLSSSGAFFSFYKAA